MSAYINGIGVISACGSTLGDFSSALLGNTTAPVPTEQGLMVDIKLADKSALKNLRRADKLSKMSVLAAREAMVSAASPECGLILATALGPHTTTFSFLDDILQYGDAGVSPTTFSNSVHNAAASYIASACGLDGPTLTVTEFMFSFHEGLRLAMSWLREGRMPRVLVGAVDVHGDVLDHVARRMLDGARYTPGEGAAFFLLEGEPNNSYAKVVAVDTGFSDSAALPTEGAALIADDDAMLRDNEAAYPEGAISYNHLFGSLMTGSAFNVAAAAVMLREGALKGQAEVMRIGCGGRKGIIRLQAI